MGLWLSVLVGLLAHQGAHTYGPADPANWIEDAVDHDTSFIDLSYLNRGEAPAGKRGFLRAVGENLQFADGTPVRFWGANVQAYSLFTEDKKRIETQAKRLSQLGFNLVRLHHHDSATWVKPSLIADGNTSTEINPKALDSYFYWVAKLKEQGIYVFIDLHNGRPFRSGDQIPGFGDLKGGEGRGLSQVNARMEALMHEFANQLLTRKNPYTGLALKDDPAVAAMMLVNENDLTHHFGNALLGDKGVPYHNGIFQERTLRFAAANQLSVDKVRRTWEPGDSKLYLNDEEFRFSNRWISDLRRIGVKVPIFAGSMWGGAPLFSLPALSAGDGTDAHAYEQGEWIDKDPRVASNFMTWLSTGQMVGKPFFVTEYNTEDSAKAQDPFTVPLAMATMSAFQGWDAPMLYGYSQDGMGGGAQGLWSSYTHPGVIGTMPAAALLFREGHVAQAKQTLNWAPTQAQLFGQAISPDSSIALRTALEQHRIAFAMPAVKVLPWLKSVAGTAFDPSRSYLADGVTKTISDTGEVTRDWAQGVQTVDTPKSQIVQGWVGGKILKTRDATFTIKTAKATVALSSLDGKPIAASGRVLLTAVARVANVNGKYRSEPVVGSVQLPAGRWAIRALGSNDWNDNLRPLPEARIDLSPKSATHWFLLIRSN